MDKCMREICKNESTVITMAYADDIAVITDNQIRLQEELRSWQEQTTRMGLKINTKKTEIMNINRIREQHDIYINNDKLKQTERFKYLGVLFTSDNSQEETIIDRIQKFNANLNMLYPLLKDKNIPIQCKVTIYTTILRPILLYGSETWSMTKKLESKIGATEMRVKICFLLCVVLCLYRLISKDLRNS